MLQIYITSFIFNHSISNLRSQIRENAAKLYCIIQIFARKDAIGDKARNYIGELCAEKNILCAPYENGNICGQQPIPSNVRPYIAAYSRRLVHHHYGALLYCVVFYCFAFVCVCVEDSHRRPPRFHHINYICNAYGYMLFSYLERAVNMRTGGPRYLRDLYIYHLVQSAPIFRISAVK